MERDVIVREVGPRDGLQLVATVLPTATKLAWIRAEAAAGVSEIEVCSFVPPKVVPQFGDAKDVAAGALAIPNILVTALVPNIKGAELGFAAGVHKLNYVLSVSQTHNQKNVRRTREQSLADLAEIVRLRNSEPRYENVLIGCGLSTSFGCSLEGHVPARETLSVMEQVLALGVDEITLADTVGYGAPGQVREIFKAALQLAGGLPLVAHFHDTRGLGLANAHAALEEGCRRFDASLAGLGGCPFAPGATGNIVTEDLIFLLEAEGLKTGIDLPALGEVRAIVELALPGEAMHGTILKAGLPKGFVAATPRLAAE